MGAPKSPRPQQLATVQNISQHHRAQSISLFCNQSTCPHQGLQQLLLSSGQPWPLLVSVFGRTACKTCSGCLLSLTTQQVFPAINRIATKLDQWRGLATLSASHWRQLVLEVKVRRAPRRCVFNTMAWLANSGSGAICHITCDRAKFVKRDDADNTVPGRNTRLIILAKRNGPSKPPCHMAAAASG